MNNEQYHVEVIDTTAYDDLKLKINEFSIKGYKVVGIVPYNYDNRPYVQIAMEKRIDIFDLVKDA